VLRVAAALVAEDDQPRLGVGALRDRAERPHPELLDRAAVERLHGDRVVLRRHLLGAPGEELGRRHVRGQVLEVAGGVLGAGDDRAALDGPLEVAVGGRDLERAHPRLVVLTRVAVSRLRLEAVEAVQGEQRPFHQRAGDPIRASVDGWQLPGQRPRAELAGPLGGGRGGNPRPLGIEILALAEPRDQDPAPFAVGHLLVGDRDLLHTPLGLARVDELLKRRIGEPLVLEQPHHAGVGVGLLAGAAAEAHFNRGHWAPSPLPSAAP
jgi:hypothetical protein